MSHRVPAAVLVAAVLVLTAMPAAADARHTLRNTIFHSHIQNGTFTCGEAKITIYQFTGIRLPLNTLCWRMVGHRRFYFVSGRNHEFYVRKSYLASKWLTQVVSWRKGDRYRHS